MKTTHEWDEPVFRVSQTDRFDVVSDATMGRPVPAEDIVARIRKLQESNNFHTRRFAESCKEYDALAAERDKLQERVREWEEEAAASATDLNELRIQTRCPQCGCSTPADAEANECGCMAPVCMVEIPTTLAEAYERIHNRNAELVAAAAHLYRVLDNERDVEDGSEGPRPNDAMRFLGEGEALWKLAGVGS